MTKLSEQEKRELKEDAMSKSRCTDFRVLANQASQLPPADYLEFLTWAASLSKEDPRLRKRPTEKTMLL